MPAVPINAALAVSNTIAPGEVQINLAAAKLAASARLMASRATQDLRQHATEFRCAG